MDHLLNVGVDRLIINTHHCPEVYLQKLPDRQWRGVPVTFRHEPVLLETAGGLKNIEDLLTEDEAIFCYNGDVMTTLSLQHLLETHEQKRPDVTLALRSSGPLLNVNINEAAEICDLRHTLKKPGVKSCLFAGIYAVETSFLQFLEPGKIESIVDVFIRKMVQDRDRSVGQLLTMGSGSKIGTVEAYQETAKRMER